MGEKESKSEKKRRERERRGGQEERRGRRREIKDTSLANSLGLSSWM